MVNMELKLLRLEAKVERKEATNRLNRSSPRGNSAFVDLPVDTIPEARQHTPSMPVAFDQLESSRLEPTHMAVFTSGASLASGVTAGSYMGDGDDSVRHNDGTDDREDGESQQSSKSVLTSYIAFLLLQYEFGASHDFDLFLQPPRKVRGHARI